ncbi:tail fiber assembly protein [Enterobacter roggenkampii]|uniref:tail fiber assembly protein n=1 Tax=Enterobacter roggenkampii TaxID=1812935 RepID=UPI00240E870B|nr:tail fiber assembly protein [Enterobacter roggenkampii]WFC80027.1 tail fiber assembly protein [Enterobacter roggenkampii]
MGRAYFSPSKLIFIPEEWKTDGTYNDTTWPPDAMLLSQEESNCFWRNDPPEGKQLGEVGGRPSWVNTPKPTAEQYIEEAEVKKKGLLLLATNKIIVWQTKLLMGRTLTNIEKSQLDKWMDFIDGLSAIDVTKSPNIDWPESPGN